MDAIIITYHNSTYVKLAWSTGYKVCNGVSEAVELAKEKGMRVRGYDIRLDALDR